VTQAIKYSFPVNHLKSAILFAVVFLFWGVLAYQSHSFQSTNVIWLLVFNAPLGLLNIFILMNTLAAPIPGLLVLSAIGFGLGWTWKMAKAGQKWAELVSTIFVLHTIIFTVGTSLIVYAISQSSS
jgi:hypothetical protein